MKITFPTLLTLTRIALLPIVVVLFYLPFGWSRPACALVFAVACVTDWLDGFLARRWGQTSSFGAFLDPVADKLMVTVSLLLLVADQPQIWLTISAMIIVSREIVISALREWMAELGQRQLVAVSWVGKIKTALQMLAIFLMLFQLPIQSRYLDEISSYETGSYILGLAAVLTLYSMLLYLYAAWHIDAEENQHR